jgi:hypothetical protein
MRANEAIRNRWWSARAARGPFAPAVSRAVRIPG